MANVVIVTDMLRGFYDIGNLKNPRTGRIVPNIVRLLEKKLQGDWRAVFLRDSHDSEDKEFEMFPVHCVKGTEETSIIYPFGNFAVSRKGKRINKKRYSGFFRTGLGAFLRKVNPQEVIVVGVCTDICILITVAELRIRDYKVIIPKDCVETYDAPGHLAEEVNEWALNYMRNILGAKIVSLDEII
ncbi:MAG: isochorismatase family cysteine hydrolase [bacterium]|nr:isochorismatase family cysteine hydrolase [bacterium]